MGVPPVGYRPVRQRRMERRRGGACVVVVADTLPDDTRIAAVFPDGPQRYAETVYSDEYCRQHNLLDRPPTVAPDTIDHPSRREVTRWSRCTTVVNPVDRLERVVP